MKKQETELRRREKTKQNELKDTGKEEKIEYCGDAAHKFPTNTKDTK